MLEQKATVFYGEASVKESTAISEQGLQLSQTVMHWGAYQIELDAGRVNAVRPFPGDPDPSPIGDSLVDVEKCRVLRPAVRRGWLERESPAAHGKRGSEQFIEIDWDEALELAAAELARVRDEHGNPAIFAGSYGWGSAGRFHHSQSQIHRFMNAIGGYTASVNTHSLAAAEVILPHVLGIGWWDFENSQTSWSVIEDNTDLVVAFGGIPLRNSQVQYGGVGRHERHRTGLPYRSGAVSGGRAMSHLRPSPS